MLSAVRGQLLLLLEIMTLGNKMLAGSMTTFRSPLFACEKIRLMSRQLLWL